MTVRLWRVFGGLAIGSVVLLFGALPIEGLTPELGSSPAKTASALMHGTLTARFGGGYVEALSMIVYLLAALLLARLLRGTSEYSGWLSSAMGATATIYVASSLVVGFPAGAAAIYDGHHGASLETVTTMNDLRNFAFFLSVAIAGVFTALAGAAILTSRLVPRWLGLAGLVIGVLSLAAVAAAGGGAHNLANAAQMLWWVVLAVVAVRVKVPGAERDLREPLPV